MTRITIVGNATGDIELRYTQSGIAVGTLNVAENWKRGDKEGVNFHRVTLWRDLAEHAAASVHKGTRVIVVGRLDQSEFEDRDGTKRKSWDVTADSVGPDLRWATAQVQRVDTRQGQPQATAPAPAAQGWDGNTWDSQNAPQTPAQPADPWAQQTLTDDTPF